MTIELLKNPGYRFAIFGAILIMVSLQTACSDSALPEGSDHLVRVADRIRTVGDFKRSFETAKMAYAYQDLQRPAVISETRLRVLHELIEELLILERASELDITVTPEELDAAVAQIKADYPADVFEQTLLENAVSYQFWREGIFLRLLTEKVIARDVLDKIEITPEDVASYLAEHPVANPAAQGGNGLDDAASKSVEHRIVRLLRQEKAEDAYGKWIQDLQKRYSVTINQTIWKRLSASRD